MSGSDVHRFRSARSYGIGQILLTDAAVYFPARSHQGGGGAGRGVSMPDQFAIVGRAFTLVLASVETAIGWTCGGVYTVYI